MRTEATLASFRALRAWEPTHQKHLVRSVIIQWSMGFKRQLGPDFKHTGVVKFASLPYTQASTSYYQHLLNVHKILLPTQDTALYVCLGTRSLLPRDASFRRSCDCPLRETFWERPSPEREICSRSGSEECSLRLWCKCGQCRAENPQRAPHSTPAKSHCEGWHLIWITA